MAFGWVSKDRHEAELARARADCDRRISRLNEQHKEEIEDLRKAIAEANILKARGRQPSDINDRYTIQVFADAKMLHQLVHGNRKHMVNIMAQQFAYEAKRMLLALSGLERIPVIPITSDPGMREWYRIGDAK